MKLFFLILILMSSLSLGAQVEFLDTQTTASTPFQLPLRIGTNGEISFMQTPGNIMFGPSVGAAYSNKTTQYNSPIKLSEVSELIGPVRPDQTWLNIRKRRYDGGLGLSMIVGNFVNAGLIPFKGAMQTMIRMKDKKNDEVSSDLGIPQDLKILESWRVGDQGTYQTYGGVEAMLAFGVSIINLARTSVAFQNQFIVGLKKVSDKIIVLSIVEEKLKRSETSIGPLVSKSSLELFRGNRASFEFALDLTNPDHHRLYLLGLQGKINQLQVSLDNREQKLNWSGVGTSSYIGVPYFIGVEKSEGSYHMITNGVDSDMNINTRLSRGIFSTVGDHNRLVFRTDDAVVLLWNSEMQKVKDNMMEKYFFSFGRWMGLRGFDREAPKGLYGSVLSQIGVTLLKDELMALKNIDGEVLNRALQVRCESMRMKCARDSKRVAILKNFSKIIQQPWETMSFDLGKLFMKNPALIHSTMKVLNLQKKVYIKFMNDNYQSVEGMVEVAL